jgi:1-acyl-sn-glycerol-3-phosphate acyltransferase
MTGWLADAFYEVSVWLSFAGLTTWFSLRTEGRKFIPRQGPALLIANHQSFMDPVLVGVAARRHLCYLARKTLFDHWLFRLITWGFNPVPVNQEGFAREGLKAILEQLERGRAVLIFPEGERTGDGKIHAFRPGIHLLIKRIEMPIVPVGIAGAYEAWPRWRPYPIPAPLFLSAGKGTIGVSIGEPVNSRCLTKKPREEVLADLFGRVQSVQKRAEQLRRKPAFGLGAETGRRQSSVPGEVASAPEPQKSAHQNRE